MTQTALSTVLKADLSCDVLLPQGMEWFRSLKGRHTMKNSEKASPERRRFFSTAFVLVWASTMLIIALFLMSVVVVRLTG